MNKLSLTALFLGSSLALAGTALAGAGRADGDCHGGKGKERMSQLDTNKDGKVSLAELVQSKQSWLREFDTNKDGVVTRTEIDTKLDAHRNERINQLFAKRDADSDGRISREESAMPARWFARIDTNSDGYLTREELTAHPGRPAATGETERKGLIARLDANGDGNIDATEVKSAAERMLKHLDRNGDGMLDAAELSHRGHHRGAGPAQGTDSDAAATQPS